MSSRVDFELTAAQLGEVARIFHQRLCAGLQRDDTELKCLPTFAPVRASQASGSAYVLDLGGSNLRASHVDLDQHIVHSPLAKVMPWERGLPFDKSRYLEEQARLLAALPQTHVAPLGYCFSYPAASQPNGDARLIRWTKGVNVPHMEGELVGAALLQYVQQHYQKRFSGVAVVNDTVTSLLAGLTLTPVDAYAGLIAGTGMNLAALINKAEISKLGSNGGGEQRLPVNLESGNFTPPYLTQWDDQLDAESENPGEQRCEKAVSGLYLGRLFALANPDLNFTAASGARGVVELIQTTADDAVRQSALSLYRRSAQLVAAQLAGLALFYRQHYQAHSLRVVAEGSLAWSAVNPDLSYQQLLMESLLQLLNQFELHHLHVEIVRVDNANLIGAAVAAALVGGRRQTET